MNSIMIKTYDMQLEQPAVSSQYAVLLVPFILRTVAKMNIPTTPVILHISASSLAHYA